MPDAPAFDLLQHCMDWARADLGALTGPEDDIMPQLVWFGPYGIGVMPMRHMLTNDVAESQLPAIMTTCVAVARASAACVVAPSWYVMMTPGQWPPSPTPREHPDRAECIMLTYCDVDGPEKHVRAVVTRFADKPPLLGEWELGGADLVLDGFGRAVQAGLSLASRMPPEVVGIIDRAWAAGEQENLLQRFHDLFVAMIATMSKP